MNTYKRDDPTVSTLFPVEVDRRGWTGFENHKTFARHDAECQFVAVKCSELDALKRKADALDALVEAGEALRYRMSCYPVPVASKAAVAEWDKAVEAAKEASK